MIDLRGSSTQQVVLPLCKWSRVVLTKTKNKQTNKKQKTNKQKKKTKNQAEKVMRSKPLSALLHSLCFTSCHDFSLCWKAT
jgi:ATP/ADP translocase